MTPGSPRLGALAAERDVGTPGCPRPLHGHNPGARGLGGLAAADSRHHLRRRRPAGGAANPRAPDRIACACPGGCNRPDRLGPEGLAGRFLAEHVPRSPEVVSAFERLFETQTVEAYVSSCRILLEANAEAIAGTVTVPCLAITGERRSVRAARGRRCFHASVFPARRRSRSSQGAAICPSLSSRSVRGRREGVPANVLDSPLTSHDYSDTRSHG